MLDMNKKEVLRAKVDVKDLIRGTLDDIAITTVDDVIRYLFTELTDCDPGDGSRLHDIKRCIAVLQSYRATCSRCHLKQIADRSAFENDDTVKGL